MYFMRLAIYIFLILVLGACDSRFNIILTAPAIPQDFRVEKLLKDEIGLVWQASEGAKSYRVERSIGPFGEPQKLASTSATNFIDTTVEPDTFYTYHLTAVNDKGSSLTISLGIITPPEIPTPIQDITTKALSASTLVISWGYQPNVEKIKVERMNDQGVFEIIGNLEGELVNQRAYADQNLQASTSYTYRLTATNISGSSETVTVTGTTLPARSSYPASQGDGLKILKWLGGVGNVDLQPYGLAPVNDKGEFSYTLQTPEANDLKSWNFDTCTATTNFNYITIKPKLRNASNESIPFTIQNT